MSMPRRCAARCAKRAPQQGVASNRCSISCSATGSRGPSPRRARATSPISPAAGSIPAALADFIADTTNRYTGVWQAAPALVQLEANALDWLRDWMEFPAETRGLFTTGGSMATSTRSSARASGYLGDDIRRLVCTRPPGASLDAEVGEARWHDARSRAAIASTIIPDASGRTARRSPPIARRAQAIHGRLHRRNHQHRRGGPARRDRRYLRREAALASHRRRVRRVFYLDAGAAACCAACRVPIR